jgi:hypothetical protein
MMMTFAESVLEIRVVVGLVIGVVWEWEAELVWK